MIHLDTSFLIRALVRGSTPDRRLRGWLKAGETLGMCCIAWTELLCGPIDPFQIELAARIVSDRPAFDENDSLLAAQLYNHSGRRRGSLADCMIAAAAIRAEATLATTNPKDFDRFTAHGLLLSNCGPN